MRARGAALAAIVLATSACSPSPAAREPLTSTPPSAATTTTAPEAPPSPTPSPSPEVKPRTYSGSGSKVIRIKATDEPLLVQSVYRGDSNFTIYGVDPSGEEGDLLANAVGNHRGTRIMNLSQEAKTAALKVSGDGTWKITIKPITQARRWGVNATRGRGDEVFALQPASEGFQTITAKYVGDDNFTVYGYTGDGQEELLVNEVGTSTAENTLPDGTFLIRVEGAGTWTLKRTS